VVPDLRSAVGGGVGGGLHASSVQLKALDTTCLTKVTNPSPTPSSRSVQDILIRRHFEELGVDLEDVRSYSRHLLPSGPSPAARFPLSNAASTATTAAIDTEGGLTGGGGGGAVAVGGGLGVGKRSMAESASLNLGSSSIVSRASGAGHAAALRGPPPSTRQRSSMGGFFGVATGSSAGAGVNGRPSLVGGRGSAVAAAAGGGGRALTEQASISGESLVSGAAGAGTGGRAGASSSGGHAPRVWSVVGFKGVQGGLPRRSAIGRALDAGAASADGGQPAGNQVGAALPPVSSAVEGCVRRKVKR